eukprot:TRINITY_DN2097_c0_g2_i1.p1 TRINITY_DN2097_c0_g2~~TRINITY_DN2097_c0_g2_i1.p1  ORF type:complete len:529 (+),score=138.16 TRINITY_DN2097_c0_g2_i1:39-1589(+)
MPRTEPVPVESTQVQEQSVAPTPAAADGKAAATALKEQGNKLFAEGKYADAVAKYSDAIAIDASNPVLFSNRAFCHIRREDFGLAIADANCALALDAKYAKGYYRRGTANFLLGHFKDAVADFRSTTQLVPRDGDARRKLRECERAEKRRLFQQAISGSGSRTPPSQEFAARLKDDWAVPSSYTGPQITRPITVDQVKSIIEAFKKQQTLHLKYAVLIVLEALAALRAEGPSVLMDVEVPNGQTFTVVGDTHGQFYDLLRIFDTCGLPSAERPYLFNGDYVDRGSWSCEIILTLFALKAAMPTAVHLARGNHETLTMNKLYGFEGEVKAKYSDSLFELFQESFGSLPVAHVLRPPQPKDDAGVFVVHGGLFSRDDVTLGELSKLPRCEEVAETGLISEMLWSDPQVLPGRAPSRRGVGFSFGPDITASFLSRNKLSLIVRSHEMKPKGYEVEQGGKLVTLFSAPNYCDFSGNLGAVMQFKSPSMAYKFVTFEAVTEKPKVPPMAYAPAMSNMLGFA